MIKQRILILGATSAIAQEMARLYAARGARLFLVARDSEKLGALAQSLGDAAVGTSVADFTEIQNAEPLVAASWDALGGVDIACIAHGLLGDQLTTEHDVTEADRVICTNFVSVVALLSPLANRFESAGSGAVAVLSSVAGDRGRPRNYTYGAAKGGLNVYLQGLRTRLWKAGVQVHTLKLGPVDTPMTKNHRKNVLFASPRAVATRIVAAIDEGRAVAYVPWYWRFIMFGVRALPEPLMQRLGFLAGR